MNSRPSKDVLDAKIKELEEKLRMLDTRTNSSDKIIQNKVMVGTSPIGFDLEDTTKEIIKANKESEQRAGLVKNTDDGSVLDEDKTSDVRIPTTSIHIFDNLKECVCKCHDNNKADCVKCYDHPIHLTTKINMHKKTIEYDDAKILELINADKAKKNKKSWWKR